MIQTNLNLKESNGVTQKEVLETLNDAYEVSEELRSKLSKIRIHIDKNNNPELINAILLIFGPTYIAKTGNSSITYDMYCATLNLIRTLGKEKAKEVL